MGPAVLVLFPLLWTLSSARTSTILDRNNNEILADEGIRYAKAATFERPTRLMTKDNDGDYEMKCPQDTKYFEPSRDFNEDCLLLNIYRKKTLNTNNNRGRPVVVYLHPGMFHWGSKDLVGPLNLLPSADIVLVTVNYRLGALGFLSTNDTDAPGNLGLWDQKEALSWVKQNIASYEGDPESITLMGHGAGAACVGFHLLHSGSSPQNFHRAVMISGGPLDPWAIQRRPREEAEILAERLKCTKSRYNMVRCIASRGVKRIVEEQEREPKLRFGPVIDNATRESFLAKDPHWLVTYRSMPAIPILLGHTGREGSFFFYEKYKDIQSQRVDAALGQLLGPLLNDTRNLESIVSAVKYHYRLRGKENTSSVDAASAHIIQVMTDFLYASGADKLYRLASETEAGKTYRYIFNYTSLTGPSFLDYLSFVNKDRAGATHLNDLFFYFDTKLPISKSIISQPELNLMNNLGQMLNNFVRDQPLANMNTAQLYRKNNQLEEINVFQSSQGIQDPKPKASEWRDRMDLWNVLVPELEAVDLTPDPDPELEHFRTATWTLTAFFVILLVIATLGGLVVLYRRKQRRPTNRDSSPQGKELAKL